MLLITIAQTLWFFLPAMVANMAPVFAAHFKWLPALQWPIDDGVKWRGRRLLGDNKTIRGFVVALIFGAITGAIQYLIQNNFSLPFAILGPHASVWQVIFFAGYLGLAALTGDAVKSFLKRQLDIAPGHAWTPWDQIDIVLGCIAFSFWFVQLTVTQIFIALIIIGCGMYFVSAIGVVFRIKKSL